ncbi:MAG: aminopeptidase [Saprospiraceae bacterium]|nr:aminopeptidase [Saprospiraceae bacterium]MBP7699661.1 aminopeptidase [Saprospiraceae bacterium]
MTILQKYAQLLVNYCLELQKNETLFIQTTILAEPLVNEVFRAATQAGAFVEINFQLDGQETITLDEGNVQQLQYISPFYKQAIETFDAYLHIRAPYQNQNSANTTDTRKQLRNEAFAAVNKTYFERIATRSLKRCLCQYPTLAAAELANMTCSEYENFVFNACNLYDENPYEKWLAVRVFQQQIVDFLHTKNTIRYVGNGTDISFKTDGRTWVNSDGRNNMPSGEVFTSPVEDSVNGVVHFSYPAILLGEEIEGVTLFVKDGYIEKWDAKIGKPALDRVFAIAGTRRFGEAAIGTNYNIRQCTKNILFDEKIGGTIHMAIGQSYLQCGGKNESAIHYDLITDMTNGGSIYANDELIYENGNFLFIN